MGYMQSLASLYLDMIIFRDLAAANARVEAFSKEQADHRIAKGGQSMSRTSYTSFKKAWNWKLEKGSPWMNLLLK